MENECSLLSSPAASAPGHLVCMGLANDDYQIAMFPQSCNLTRIHQDLQTFVLV